MHSNRGSGSHSSRESPPPRASCLLDSIWSLLVLTRFCFRCYILGCIYLRSEAGRGQETKSLATFAATMAFIVCLCLCKSFERIFCAVCMVNGSRGAKKQWYKDALQTSLTRKAVNNDIHSYLCPPFIRGVLRKSWAEHFLHVFTWQLHLLQCS